MDREELPRPDFDPWKEWPWLRALVLLSIALALLEVGYLVWRLL